MIRTTAVVAVVFFLIWMTGPRRADRTGLPSPGPTAADRTVRGAFHIHTTRSDGALEKNAVAAAARRAGLQFAIFTDHGDGTTAPDPPEYLNGVLCIDGVEVSTNGGHYVAVGMSTAPYPLGGDADAVAEDVARLGGFGVAAHPLSPRAELAWTDWSIPIDGIEWLNADSEWRDEGRIRLSRALLDYLWRPVGALASLLDRPTEALRRWDQLTAAGPVVGLAGHDAHGGLGAETGNARGRRLHVPSYAASFETFSLHVTLPQPWSGSPAQDAQALLRAMRGGSVFTVVEAIAAPAAFAFSATAGDRTVTAGGALHADLGPARFSIRAAAPANATSILLRDGRPVAEGSGGVLDHSASLPGVYRVEIHSPRAPGTPPVPWLVSNPIYRSAGMSRDVTEPAPHPVSILPLVQRLWRVESDAGSTGQVVSDGQSVRLTYRLRKDARASQFVAFVVDLGLVPPDVDTVVLRGHAEQPMRASVQLRFAAPTDDRWRRSIYLDRTERDMRIPVRQLRAAGSTISRPPTHRATSLLIVVDLTNALPGAEGSFTLRDVALARQIH